MLAPGLSVWIDDGHTRRMVTRYCSDLRFTKVAPGGHQQLQVQVTLPRGTFPNLGPNDRIIVTDQRTASVVFDGYLKHPTPVEGPFGQFYDLDCYGGMWRASDENRALIYVDQRLDAWGGVEYGAAAKAASEAQFQDPTVAANNGWKVQVGSSPDSTATNEVAAIDYRAIQDAGMEVAAVRVVTQSGKTDTAWRTELYDFIGSAVSVADPAGMTTSPFDETFWGGTDIDAATEVVLLQLRRSGGSTVVSDDDTWTTFLAMSVLGRRMDRYGNLLTGSTAHGGTALSVFAHQVVEDLLGRVLTMCDPETAVVEPTSWAIDQLAYADGAKAATVLTDLQGWESSFTWAIGARLASGLHEFEWRPWPTDPRYEVSTADGWVERGSDSDVCNRVLVTWNDPKGRQLSLAVTAADLLADGLITEADIDDSGDGLTPGQIRDAERQSLPDGLGSVANAARAGRQVLLETITPPRAGNVKVRQPILDHLTGVQVMPWELEPGYVCRVRERGYDLRITQADYDHTEQAMQLTLGTPVLTEEQRVARLDAA